MPDHCPDLDDIASDVQKLNDVIFNYDPPGLLIRFSDLSSKLKFLNSLLSILIPISFLILVALLGVVFRLYT